MFKPYDPNKVIITIDDTIVFLPAESNKKLFDLDSVDMVFSFRTTIFDYNSDFLANLLLAGEPDHQTLLVSYGGKILLEMAGYLEIPNYCLMTEPSNITWKFQIAKIVKMSPSIPQ